MMDLGEGGAEGVDEGGEGGAGDGAEEGDPCVAPAAVSFAADRQQRVGEARAEVAGGIDGVAGGAAERHAYHHHKECDRQCADGTEAHFGGVAFFGKEEYDYHKHKGADGLGEEIAEAVSDGRNGGEHAEFGVGAVGGVEMVLIEQVYSGASEESSYELRHYIGRHHGPREFSGHGEAECDGRVEVGAGVWPGEEDTAHHGKTPRYGHHDPAGTVALGFFEGGASYYAAAQQYHYKCSEKLKETLQYKGGFRTFHISSVNR